MTTKRKIVAATLFALLTALPAVAQEDEWKKDHPLISRYPGSEPMGSPGQWRDFDEYPLVLGKVKGEGQAETLRTVEGRIYTVHYRNPQGRSVLEVYRNYQAALTGKGFKVLYACTNVQCGESGKFSGGMRFYAPDYRRLYLVAELTRPEGPAYVAVLAQTQDPAWPGDTQLAVIEVKPMQTGLVTVDAAALASDITRTGHVAVYGIYFDTGKTEIKPESEPTLKEIAKLLQQNPQLNLHIVGHTDSVGELAYNMDLSRRRATAVVQVLTSKHGVAGARLRAEGVGPLSPVASNDTEEGRAKNRRVELVKQ